MNYFKEEEKININDISLSPNDYSVYNLDNNSFLSNRNNNLLESQKIEDKCNLSFYQNSYIDILGCNTYHQSSEFGNKNILLSPSKENHNYQNNIFDVDVDINIYECYYTSKNTTKAKTNTNYKCLFNIKRKRDKNEILDINNLGRKFDEDNIISKIKNSYTKCTIDLFNGIIKSKNYENIKFNYISHDISKKSTKKDIEAMRTETIEECFSKNTSTKYCNNENHNKIVCSIIKKDEKYKDIAKLLALKFLFFFDKIYHQKRKEIYRLSDYGINDIDDILFKLPKKTKLYEDLLEKNKDKPFCENYKTEMEICCKLYFNLDYKIPKFQVKKKKRNIKNN